MYPTLLFRLCLEVMTRHTQRLHVVVNVVSTLSQGDDVITNRSRCSAPVPFTVDAQRLAIEELQPELLETAPPNACRFIVRRLPRATRARGRDAWREVRHYTPRP